jgi:hypothetical protein
MPAQIPIQHVVALQPLGLPSFSSAITGLVPAGGATDIATVTGASGVVVQVTRIIISGIATAATSATFLLVRRTTANSGGTSSAVTPVSQDGKEAAAASVLSYTANPALGTSTAPGGTTKSFIVPLGTASAPQAPVILDLTAGGQIPPTLRGTGDVFAINFNGATVAGNSVNITIEHQENKLSP